MSGTGHEPVGYQLGGVMKTRPAILRSSVKAAVVDVKQTVLLENGDVLKRPILHLQGLALKRTTCADITNVCICVNQPSMCLKEENQNTTKAPRKQRMRSMREADVAENVREDSLNWFLQEDGLSARTEPVAESQSPQSKEMAQDQSLLEEFVPRPLHLSITYSLEEPVVPAIYAEDIFNYMTQREKQFALSSYINRQPEISVHMRAILIDWMVEVQECYDLLLETLYLAVKMVDCFLSKQLCQREELQLLGATSLLIAAKFEEFCLLYVDDFLYICDDSYKRDEMLRVERTILQVLDFDINIPTVYSFLHHYSKSTEVGMKTLALAHYLCELTLQDYSYMEERAFCVASACLCLAMKMVGPDGKVLEARRMLATAHARNLHVEPLKMGPPHGSG
ncbi:G2/mitotic-specific cyclin-B3-like [Carcharodon carcharias]|uniref:G2/mitotic-specific cyclin-B3-like n=1 Tax=Carcharodon carcharias TaxID=13397 RepID=UPI001B7DFB19|nr:G2/mitotic-specific cyclin-B3-like [Carcharodon carcharias]